MSSHRIAAAAVAFALASLVPLARAEACDERILGSCQPAPISNESAAVPVEADAYAGTQDQASRPAVKKRSARYSRKRSYRRRHAAASKPARSGEIAELDRKASAPSAFGVDGAERQSEEKRRDRRAENSGNPIANDGEETTPDRGSAAPVPSPAAPQPNLLVGTGADNSLIAAPVTAPPIEAQASFVPAKAAEAAPEQSARSQAVPDDKAEMTTLRAMFLTFGGLLALATAVRMVV